MKRFLVAIALLTLAACAQAPTPEAGVPLDLAPMFGSSSADFASDLANNDLGVYVVGQTYSNLHGAHKGKGDAYIRKEDQYGRLLWGRQFGTSATDEASGVASDSSNNAYVVGRTFGSLASTHQGNGDNYIRKYDPDGRHVWTRQFGSRGYDFIYSVAVYGDSVYVVGDFGGLSFVRKYSASGSLVWTRHSSSNKPASLLDVAIDQSGGVYVVGASGNLGDERNMLIRKLNPSGGILWTRQVNYSKDEYASAVAVSGDHIYMVGNYFNNNNTSDYNVAVTKFTTDGRQLWSNTYGSYGQDLVSGASADSNGDLYFAGSTTTSFAGPNQGGYDGYVVKVSHNGYRPPLWSKTIGTSLNDFGAAVVTRPLATKNCAVAYFDYCNQIYVAGYTYGALPYVGNWGERDAYLRRLNSADGATVWTK